jgi:hypothetical protein
MICPKCSTAADLMEAATAVFAEREARPDVLIVEYAPGRDSVTMTPERTGLTAEDGPMALATAAAVVRLHSECEGGVQGCGCQHLAGRP